MTATISVTRIQGTQAVLWRHHKLHTLDTFGAND
ncbi:hypothetical protein VPHK479_0057 [Vibrio phage K479]